MSSKGRIPQVGLISNRFLLRLAVEIPGLLYIGLGANGPQWPIDLNLLGQWDLLSWSEA